MSDAALGYVRAGLALVPIPHGAKAPNTTAWQRREHCILDEGTAARVNGGNLGLAHAYCTPTPTGALDIDDFENAEIWLRERGIDLSALLTADNAVQIRSGRPGRAKLLYRLPHALATVKPEGSGLELRCASRDGATVQDVLPPSIHPETRRPYTWGGAGTYDAIPTIPPALLVLWRTLIETPRARIGQRQGDGTRIGAGGRNDALTSVAGVMRRRGISPQAIEAALLAENAVRCDPPLLVDEVRSIARSVSRYAPEAEPAAPADILRQIVAPPFDYDDVPEPLARLARAWFEATGFDRSGLIVSGIVAAAAAIDDRYRLAVRPASEWYESARLWGVLLGGPSAGKSPTLRIAADPIRQIHADLYREWQRQCEGCGEGEDKPPRPALFTSDATVEKLSDILHDNARGVLMFTEEFGSFIGGIDAYRNGQGKDRGEWLQLYDGGPHQIDRVKRGSFLVPNWSASVLAAGTPAGLRKFAPELPEDGLIHRFIPCVMGTPGAYGSGDCKALAREWSARLRDIYTRSTSKATHARARFAFDAQAMFDAEVARLRDIASALADAAPALAAHLGKHAGMLARVALTFHWLDARTSDAIEADTVRRAIQFMQRARRHANALFSGILSAAPAYELARSIARSLVADEGRPATIGRYYMTQRCRAFRTAPAHERRAAIELLEDARWITPFADSRAYGGLPGAWTVDARVFDLFAAEGERHRARRAAVKEAFAP